MTERDLNRICAVYVADVHLSDAARRRIRQAVTQKEEKPVKYVQKKRMAAALLMALMLLAGAAVAAGTGMLDFLSGKMGQTVLPGAERIVQSNIGTVETEYAAFHVRQAAYDGQSALIMAEAVPADGGYLLIEETACPEEDRIALLIPELQDSTQTIAEYAAENGLTLVVATMRKSYPADAVEITDWNNGVLTLMKSFNAAGESIPVTLTFSTFPYQQADRYDEVVSIARMEVELQAAESLWEVSAEQAADLPEYGVRIEGMHVTGTLLQSYYEVSCTVTDISKVQSGGFRLDVLDADGQPLPRGMLGVGGSNLPQQDGDELIWHGGFGASGTAPDQLILRIRPMDGHAEPVLIPITLK